MYVKERLRNRLGITNAPSIGQGGFHISKSRDAEHHGIGEQNAIIIMMPQTKFLCLLHKLIITTKAHY